MSKEDFIANPTNTTTPIEETSGFVLSDYSGTEDSDSDSEIDSDASEDDFEDSREALSDSNYEANVSSDSLSPVQDKSIFVNITQTASKPSIQQAPKREANSPANTVSSKKIKEIKSTTSKK